MYGYSPLTELDQPLLDGPFEPDESLEEPLEVPPKVESYKPTLIETLKETKFKRGILAEKLAKTHLIDFTDMIIRPDIHFLTQRLKMCSLTKTSVYFDLKIVDTSSFLVCKELKSLWKELTFLNSNLPNSSFFLKVWVAFVEKQFTKLLNDFSAESGIPIVKDRTLPEGMNLDLIAARINVWW